MPSTIRDVAQQAGVSMSTVSRVFNRRELVNTETRTLVEAVAARLQYVPNATARSLVTSRTTVVGAVLPELFDEFFPEVIRGIDQAAQAAGYQLLLSSSHNRVEDAKKAFGMMRGRVDGLIVMAPYVGAETLLGEWPNDCPLVFLHPLADPSAGETFCIDNRGGALSATRHLLDLGHTRIAFVRGKKHNLDSIEREEGYAEALRNVGLTPDPALIMDGEFTREGGAEAMAHLLALPEPPTAVFCANDYMALGALKTCLDAGKRVPEDVALIGFDDVASSRYSTPALSTVHVPVGEIGRQATQRLIELIGSGEKPEPRAIVTRTELVPRATTVPA